MRYQQIPNFLTLTRLLLAGAFFLILNQYRYATGGPSGWLISALILFILAAITDALDGWLARQWHVESAFGRVMDPFCDKVLILGALIYLAGPRFVIPEIASQRGFFNMVSGVYPWMVALILARELLVTSIRSEVESTGIAFGANRFGKLKMILQSLVIPAVLLIVWYDPREPGHAWAGHLRDILVYLTVLTTVLSSLPYLTGASAVLRRPA